MFTRLGLRSDENSVKQGMKQRVEKKNFVLAT